MMSKSFAEMAGNRHIAYLLLFPKLFRYELLRFAHLAADNLSQTAAPPDRKWEGPESTQANGMVAPT